MPRALLVVVTAVAAVYLLRRVRKPDKFAGRLFIWLMNKSHSSLTDWGLEHVRIERSFSILDVAVAAEGRFRSSRQKRPKEKLSELTTQAGASLRLAQRMRS